MKDYKMSLLFRSGWLLEQLTKTNLEIAPNLEPHAATTHSGLFEINGKTYEAKFTMQEKS